MFILIPTRSGALLRSSQQYTEVLYGQIHELYIIGEPKVCDVLAVNVDAKPFLVQNKDNVF